MTGSDEPKPNRKKTTFAAGPNHPQTARARARAEIRAGLVELPPDAPVDLLANMRHVCRSVVDVTPGQKAARVWLKEKPDDFYKHMTKLEEAAAPKVEPVAPAENHVPSEKTVEIRELIAMTLAGAKAASQS